MLTEVGKEAAQPCTVRNALSPVAQPSLTMMGQRQSLPPTPSASPCHNPVRRWFSGYTWSFPIGEPLPARPFLCQPSNNMLCKGTEIQASTDPSLSQGCDWSLCEGWGSSKRPGRTGSADRVSGRESWLPVKAADWERVVGIAAEVEFEDGIGEQIRDRAWGQVRGSRFAGDRNKAAKPKRNRFAKDTRCRVESDDLGARSLLRSEEHTS